MSALAKPMIKPASATSGSAINAEKVLSYEKESVVNAVGSSNGIFRINFTFQQGHAPHIVSWEYADQATMDADFALLENTITAVIA